MPFNVYQALWGMTALPHGGDREWSLEEKVEQSMAGGFDGIDIPWTPMFPSMEAVQLAQRASHPFGMTCFPTSVEDFRGIADAFVRLDPAPTYVNVQPNYRVSTINEAIPYLQGLSGIAADAGLPITIETHRDRMTTNLRFTLQLIDALPELRLTADLSHYVVGEEFNVWPVSDEDQALIHRIIERSDAFHGRVASREQVQITPAWERHGNWLALFQGWWEDGFGLWTERSQPGDNLFFVCELGPPWYAITDEDGNELSDRWEDALFLQRVAREIWERVAAPRVAAS
jgi:hypothetical protein